MKTINDLMYRYLSVRAVLWNFFAADDSGSLDFDNTRQNSFFELEPILFRLVVGGGKDVVVHVSIKGGEEEIDALITRASRFENAVWENQTLRRSDLVDLTFMEFFSFNEYEYGVPEYVHASARLKLGDLGSDVRVLLRPREVDFYVKGSARQ